MKAPAVSPERAGVVESLLTTARPRVYMPRSQAICRIEVECILLPAFDARQPSPGSKARHGRNAVIIEERALSRIPASVCFDKFFNLCLCHSQLEVALESMECDLTRNPHNPWVTKQEHEADEDSDHDRKCTAVALCDCR